MNYPDGQEVQIGDRVTLWVDAEGVVVCSIDRDEYSNDYPREQWMHLGKGVLILSPVAGLIHYTTSEPTMRLLSRNS
jgi:hypothetical protein